MSLNPNKNSASMGERRKKGEKVSWGGILLLASHVRYIMKYLGGPDGVLGNRACPPFYPPLLPSTCLSVSLFFGHFA